ncbi:MAG: prolipoprotein diacylglyceryl transferase [Planctomycetota bacterium]|nr:prolipoprotein diacylglyceryl transferase [Planctomycetota bacterium]
MMQDLCYLPSRIAGVPLFGFGILFVVWCSLAAAWSLWHVARHGWRNADLGGHLVSIGLVAAVLVFLGRMTLDRNGVERGIPIRGYGVFLLLGITSGMVLAIYRGSLRGLSAEVMQRLAMWMFVPGVVGARLFYVIQYRAEFQRDTFGETLYACLRLTEGGLVVFGALLGAAAGFVWFCYRNRISPLPLGDVIAPSLLVGLAFGRLGCLMNGCCYGGMCDYPWAITFPSQANSTHDPSPVYARQFHSGVFDGLSLATQGSQVVVAQVTADGLAARAGLQVGDIVVRVNGRAVSSSELAHDLLSMPGEPVRRIVELVDGRTLNWTLELPSRSRPVHPTQIYSAINALVLLLFVLTLEPIVQRDGVLIATTLTLKPITRSLLEVIRVDEGGLGSFGLTISQTVGLAILLFALGLWYVIVRRPVGRERSICGSGPPIAEPQPARFRNNNA